jgi:hypothetical protein
MASRVPGNGDNLGQQIAEPIGVASPVDGCGLLI